MLVALARQAARDGDGDNMLRVDATIPARGEVSFDFVHPASDCTSPSDLAAYASLSFDVTLARFRGEWERRLSPAVRLTVPEPRVEKMVRAVLAQLLINADGNIMPYGAAPSVYEGSLFGIEESYAMLGLAQWGLANDAERFLDATYLTPDFSEKSRRVSRIRRPSSAVS